ncbi:putative hydrolase of the HAD superfamily [Sphingomonas jinjuensis]|uniref:Putative hydrolase of the HAD superfamily n=1 Tax=Sphingomonas jinjuensis TaxID=535907 RepID=A0A840FAJ9_9SPHN|nr:HAD-IA family hydrolase [Sphingomonas jinjuensis]MBB4153306.1 putative hydrolase of the HAD superfamily [Sphingomonas jinjuensis]
MNERTAVLFDFGGVITTSPFEAFARLEAERGLPAGLIRRINATDPDGNAWALFERAEIDAAAFDTRFAEEARALGHALRGEDVLAVLVGDIRPGMVRALDRLVALRFRIGCITNNVPSGDGPGMARDPAKAALLADVLARFEVVVESSVEGVRKPDPLIYAIACERLGVAPETCVFLDDLGVNCKGAAGLGMAAIKVTGERQALGELEQVLGMESGSLS